jgi:tetratricopeptide (TPR) repeat protein
VLIAAASAGYFFIRRGPALPSPDSQTYQDLVRTFYRGRAALDTGLLDSAKLEFTRATALVPREPAPWANLGIAHLRLGEFDAAARAIGQASTGAPRNTDILMAQGALESARGRLDEAMAAFRRAAELDPQSAKARFALAETIERARGEEGTADTEGLLDEVLAMQPGNLAVLVDRTRLAARRRDARGLDESVRRVSDRSSAWPPAAMEQLNALRDATAAGDFVAAGRAIAFLRNVLARVPEYRESLAAVRVPAELMAEPLDRFLALPSPSPSPSPPDMALEFLRETLASGAIQSTAVVAWPLGTDGAIGVFAADGRAVRRVDVEGTSPIPANVGTPAGTLSRSERILPLDWNHDFRADLLLTGSGGVRLLIQSGDGTFSDRTPASGDGSRTSAFGAWPADLEMDGDLDVLVGATNGAPMALRNNGDGTWATLRPFDDVQAVRGFGWGDIDRDGDPDAVLLDASGALHVFANQQAGTFERRPGPSAGGRVVALALGDPDADGVVDVLTLDATGLVRRASSRGDRSQSDAGRGVTLASDQWIEESVAKVQGLPPDAAPGAYRLLLADLDNNGGLDLVAAGPTGSQIWLSDEQTMLQPLDTIPGADVFGIEDLNADGRLDLVGLSAGQPVRLLGRGTRDYHWQVIRARAQTAAGDQRINAFGVGGDIEVRSGLLFQKQLLTGAPVHVGLGTRTTVDVARIVWPNGVMQAEFDLRIDQAVVAVQRLKGSCPWVFAYDGHEMGFVTDFLWRSPLGLRINALETAGSNQTEDWIKIRGDQLVPSDGMYDVRITAELWESHFFDHVSLMAVDHPADVDVFVDERFARQPPSLAVRAMTSPTPVARAWDDQGRDVTALVQDRDGRHAAGFDKGPYQGLTREHYLEFDIGEPVASRAAPDRGDLWLIASGWVYPTDSSINVAIAQGAHPAPHGLALDAEDVTGAWHTVNPDLGFPAGKNKTIVIDLAGRPQGARRLRLRTNMEIYWDALAIALETPEATLRMARIAPTRAELRYRGFSRTSEDAAAHAPEVPHYARLANTVPRWRDLVGYHTRLGDVVPLLERVDDRYVIMNAGDEMSLSFAAPPPPAVGWTRDFVLIGDGWEKDGDFNTGYSKTVQPLPLHDRPNYVASSPSSDLEDDPAYRRHPADWQIYHTRFIAPDRYLRGLRSR